MNLSMQQRDAILAGLALLRGELGEGKVLINKADPEATPIGDLFTNGAMHDGLTIAQIGELADFVVHSYPAPEIR